MEGEHEYGFWHVLVRDVCYGQIPRAARAARHLAAASWIEEKARERVEDLADVLAYHYQAALELSHAAGAGEQTEQLQAQVVRYLALAGERALSLDIEQAERQLARALDLATAGDPVRASLLDRWAQAAQQRGRLQEARQAFQQALDLYREQGELVAAGRVLTRLALVVHRLGDPGSEELLAESRALLEEQPAGPSSSARTPTRPGATRSRTDIPRRSRAAERALDARIRARPPRARICAPLAGRCPLCPWGRRRARGPAPGASAYPRTEPGTRGGRDLRQPRRGHLVLPRAAGSARRLRRGNRLLRAPRHRRDGAADSLLRSRPRWPSSATPSRRSSRRGRSPTRSRPAVT